MDPINTAVTGLNAASQRVAVSANNIVNSQSTVAEQNGRTVNQPYVPQQVVQRSQTGGGVGTSLRDVSPPSVPVFSPDSPVADENGMVQTPNVDLNFEVANTLLASNAYKASASVIKRADEMYQSLLDIQS